MKSLVEVRAEVQKISKESGNPGIEPGIFELVVALRYCGFKTTGSCGGHFDAEEHIYPWVILVATNYPSPFVRRTEEQIQQAEPVALAWQQESKRLQLALSSFDSLRPRRPVDERLVLEMSTYGGRIATANADLLDKLPRELISIREAENIIVRYRIMVAEFAEYLTGKFLVTEQLMREREEREGRP